MNIRPMTLDDADFMLELKNDSDTRSFALLTNEEIKREDHYKYLSDNLEYFRVVEFGENRIAAYRIQDNEISIWVKKEWRGNSVARKILKRLATPDVAPMTAKIVTSNIASLKAFIRAGFLPVELKTLPRPHYIMKYEEM